MRIVEWPELAEKFEAAIFELRCCTRAQWEIRALANAMLAEVKKVAPLLFEHAGATCDSMGICFEGDMSCGRCPNVIKR